MQFPQPSFTPSLLQSCPYTYHKVVWKKRRYNLHSFLILVLDEGGWSASCPRPLYPGGKGRLCLFNRRLGGPQSRSEPFYRRETSLASAGIRTPDHPVHSLFTILTMLSQLPFLHFTSKYSTKHCILKSPLLFKYHQLCQFQLSLQTQQWTPHCWALDLFTSSGKG